MRATGATGCSLTRPSYDPQHNAPSNFGNLLRRISCAIRGLQAQGGYAIQDFHTRANAATEYHLL